MPRLRLSLRFSPFAATYATKAPLARPSGHLAKEAIMTGKMGSKIIQGWPEKLA
jgi:hypothetical protein